MSFIDEIEVERERIRRRLDAVELKLERLPQGGLSCRICGHTHKWFRIEDVAVQEDGEINHKRKYVYLPKSNAELAGQLALRQYYEAVQVDLQKQADALDKMQHVLEEDCRQAEGVLAREGMAELIVPKLSRKDAYLEAWLAEDYPKGAGYEDRLRVPTIGGFNVRSKSESLIANLLLERKIPFRYECRLTLEARNYYPDFTILHPDTHEIVLWEHFGMMASPDYQAECATKLSRYFANGYLPYRNLIVTTETDETPLNAARVGRIVKMMFDR